MVKEQRTDHSTQKEGSRNKSQEQRDSNLKKKKKNKQEITTKKR